MTVQVRIAARQGDALDSDADVLALKHAQGLFGVDASAVERLRAQGIEMLGKLPDPTSFVLVESKSAVRASSVLFVGVSASGTSDTDRSGYSVAASLDPLLQRHLIREPSCVRSTVRATDSTSLKPSSRK